jgi:hypothetical protein
MLASQVALQPVMVSGPPRRHPPPSRRSRLGRPHPPLPQPQLPQLPLRHSTLGLQLLHLPAGLALLLPLPPPLLLDSVAASAAASVADPTQHLPSPRKRQHPLGSGSDQAHQPSPASVAALARPQQLLLLLPLGDPVASVPASASISHRLLPPARPRHSTSMPIPPLQLHQPPHPLAPAFPLALRPPHLLHSLSSSTERQAELRQHPTHQAEHQQEASGLARARQRMVYRASGARSLARRQMGDLAWGWRVMRMRLVVRDGGRSSRCGGRSRVVRGLAGGRDVRYVGRRC